MILRKGGREGWKVVTRATLLVHVSSLGVFSLRTAALERVRVLLMARCTLRELWPLSTKCFFSACACFEKSESLEQIRLSLRAWLYAMPVLQCLGWQLVAWRYWWVSVGLEYKSVIKVSSSLRMVTSRKWASWSEMSAVNLMVLWKELMWLMKERRLFSSLVQIKKTSSMYRHQIQGRQGAEASMRSSSSDMKMQAKEGAMRVPIAVPCTCR